MTNKRKTTRAAEPSPRYLEAVERERRALKALLATMAAVHAHPDEREVDGE